MVAAGFGIIEAVGALVGFFDFLGSVAEWIAAMNCSSNGHGHLGSENRAIGAFDALGCYFEYS